jgi:hypothetical protein
VRWVFASFAALAALAALAACSTVPRPIPPFPENMDIDAYGAMQFYAAVTMNCPREQVDYYTFERGQRHLFKGCSRALEMLQLKEKDALAYGFEGTFAIPSPTNLFSHDNACPILATKDERVDYRTHIVSGCGRSTTYVNTASPQCRWVAAAASR